MHPEVEQDHPGHCPKCGMDLELSTASANEVDEDTVVGELSRKFWIAFVFTLPVLFLAMGKMLPSYGLGNFLSHNKGKWLELFFSTPVVFWAGSIFFKRAWDSIIHRSPNMFTLIAIGVGSAYLFSLVAVLAPGVFPEAYQHEGEVGLYFEAAAVIVTLVLLGQLLEAKARRQTGKAVQALLKLGAKTAHRMRDG